LSRLRSGLGQLDRPSFWSLHKLLVFFYSDLGQLQLAFVWTFTNLASCLGERARTMVPGRVRVDSDRES
jgi:hypothetical protein